MMRHLILPLLLLIAEIEAGWCFNGGFNPYERLIDRIATKQFKSGTLPKEVYREDTTTVCFAVFYEAQWEDAIKAEDVYFGYGSLNTSQTMLKDKAVRDHLTHKTTKQSVTSNTYFLENNDTPCYPVDWESYKQSDFGNGRRINWAWMCMCYDPREICNDLAFLKTQFARITFDHSSASDLVHTPLQSIDYEIYTEYMSQLWDNRNSRHEIDPHQPAFTQPGMCLERYVHQPYGYVKLNTIDVLNESVVGTMFYSGLFNGPIWCAMTIGRISSSHGTIIPFSKYKTGKAFTDGIYVKNDSLVNNELMDFEEGTVICHVKTDKRMRGNTQQTWFRSYMPEDVTDEPVILCACNYDYCNSIENTKIIRDHYNKLNPSKHVKKDIKNSQRYEQKEIWSDAYPPTH